MAEITLTYRAHHQWWSLKFSCVVYYKNVPSLGFVLA